MAARRAAGPASVDIPGKAEPVKVVVLLEVAALAWDKVEKAGMRAALLVAAAAVATMEMVGTLAVAAAAAA